MNVSHRYNPREYTLLLHALSFSPVSLPACQCVRARPYPVTVLLAVTPFMSVASPSTLVKTESPENFQLAAIAGEMVDDDA